MSVLPSFSVFFFVINALWMFYPCRLFCGSLRSKANLAQTLWYCLTHWLLHEFFHCHCFVSVLPILPLCSLLSSSLLHEFSHCHCFMSVLPMSSFLSVLSLLHEFSPLVLIWYHFLSNVCVSSLHVYMSFEGFFHRLSLGCKVLWRSQILCEVLDLCGLPVSTSTFSCYFQIRKLLFCVVQWVYIFLWWFCFLSF